MPARMAAQRLLRPLTTRLDDLAAARAADAALLTDLVARQTALTETLRARDEHWERRVLDLTARIETQLDAIRADLDGLRDDLECLRGEHVESLAYVARRTSGPAADG
jgi:hypothetical protein